METTSQLKNMLCAQCGQLTVNLNQQTKQLKCSNCNNIVNLQIYQKSIQFLYQQLIVQALNFAIGKNMGIVVYYLNKYYIVYFDINQQINIAQLDQLTQQQKLPVGTIVKIISDQNQNLVYEPVVK